MRRDGGHVLVELLVASVCAALLGAAALALLANGVSASARAGERLLRGALARSCRDALVDDLGRALRGLEGAHSVWEGGVPRRRAALHGSDLELLQSLDVPVEVAVMTGDRFRLAAARGVERLVPGTLVAALPPTGGVVALGAVRALASSRSGSEVSIDWSRVDDGLRPDPVRALALVRWRRFRIVPSTTGVDLRRRDGDGNWQPVVDGLAAIDVRDPAFFPGWLRAAAFGRPPGAPPRAIGVTCDAGGAAGAASGWVTSASAGPP